MRPRETLQRAIRILISDYFVPMSLKRPILCFSIECRKTKTIIITSTNQGKVNVTIDQWALKLNTGNLLEARENARNQVREDARDQARENASVGIGFS